MTEREYYTRGLNPELCKIHDSDHFWWMMVDQFWLMIRSVWWIALWWLGFVWVFTTFTNFYIIIPR